MSRLSAAVFAVLLISPRVFSQSKAASRPAMTRLEARARLSIESLRNSPLELRNLLLKMPKGADLHNHLAGAVYAETWIRNAAEDNMCLDTGALGGTSHVYSRAADNPPACAAGTIPASDAFKDQQVY